ncbi:PKD domain-containing protein [Silvibacterium acidisoli]|uniref:PKD domain-containing protein n=1 Tax=Acidobacteriaceae bacterium ZG23-2 TaxID=2883246 RepID=UPI00406C0628
MRKIALLLVCFAAFSAQAKVSLAPVPEEVRSTRFDIRIDGQPAQVTHAAANYDFLNFDLKGKAKISITAPTDDYWSKGVEVQPWRLGIRPFVQGRTISFTLDHPVKLSIARPGEHLAGATMLFLFANALETDAPAPNDPHVRYYGPGIHRESIDAKAGDNIYLAPGAVVFGSLNIWQVENVKVWGRGTLIYEGTQNPNDDDGWKQLKNWHCIGMNDAHHVSISGITCVVRTRTWMIQMKDSGQVTFDNVKVIGGSDANANQDGMDWLGGGDTVVRDCFIRAADDVFAMQGNWDGYDHAAMIAPGHDVSNITVENSVVSTSISNVVRAAWPEKVFNGTNFTMRDSDVIHGGIGSCGIPFALFEMWATNGATGHSSGFHFDNIRLEDWYSLAQIEQPNPSIGDVTFTNIWSIENPSLVPSTLLGDIDGVRMDHVRIADRIVTNNAELPITAIGGAKDPVYTPGPVHAAFSYTRGAIRPKDRVAFDASASGPHIRRYQWSFGDGTTDTGRKVHHEFVDNSGTLWDHTGRYRVILTVTDDAGHTDSIYQPVAVSDVVRSANLDAGRQAGLKYRYFETAALNDLKMATPKSEGIVPTFETTVRKRDDNYGMVFTGFLDVPADGGYTFTMLARDGARLEIDSTIVAENPAPFAQVCGSAGNAVQTAGGSISLRAGRHPLRVSMTHTSGPHDFRVLWQGPGVPLATLPPESLTH